MAGAALMARTVSSTDAGAGDDLTVRYYFPDDEPLRSDRLANGVTVQHPVLVDAALPGQPLIHLRFEVEGGKLVIVRLELVRRDGAAGISASLVRDLPIAQVVKAVLAPACSRPFPSSTSSASEPSPPGRRATLRPRRRDHRAARDRVRTPPRWRHARSERRPGGPSRRRSPCPSRWTRRSAA